PEFEASEFAVDSAGERAPFVAEEFAFDERGRERGAVDFQKGRVASRTEFVNETREVVFAGAGFASDEECGGGSGDFFREIEQAARSGVFGDPGEAVGHGSIVTRVPNHGVRGLADVAEEATNSARNSLSAAGAVSARTHAARAVLELLLANYVESLGL